MKRILCPKERKANIEIIIISGKLYWKKTDASVKFISACMMMVLRFAMNFLAKAPF